MTAATVVTYTRRATYISDVSGGKTCYGLLGTPVVGGQRSRAQAPKRRPGECAQPILT